MQSTLTVVFQAPGATWYRELTQQQVLAVARALELAAISERDWRDRRDAAARYEDALRHEAMASLYAETREAWLDIAHADREEG